jgi:hypothetical protein
MAQHLVTVVRTERLAAPSAITAAFAVTTRSTIGIITELNHQIALTPDGGLGQNVQFLPATSATASMTQSAIGLRAHRQPYAQGGRWEGPHSRPTEK